MNKKTSSSTAGLDLWFREGYIVPEPSVICMSLMGIIATVWLKRKKAV
jgi:hypothetical protein